MAAEMHKILSPFCDVQGRSISLRDGREQSPFKAACAEGIVQP